MDVTFSPACERNKQPILSVLRQWLPAPARVLEIGSGSGQHAAFFSQELAGLRWQPSERPESLADLNASLERQAPIRLAEGAALGQPLALDVDCADQWPRSVFEAVFTANTLHIMAAASIPNLLAGSAGVLAEGGLLVIYGPFRYGGEHTAASNAAFDAHLRALDPAMGVRDAEAVVAQAARCRLMLAGDAAMPANNRCLVFQRQADG